MQKKHKILVSDLFEYSSNYTDNLDITICSNLGKEPEKLIEKINGFEGLIVRNVTQVNKELLKHAQNLKIVGRLGVGLDNLDLEELNRLNIPAVYTPTANSNSVAEYCLGQILNLFRLLPLASDSTTKGNWSRSQFIGREISNSTFGIIGFGNSGKCLAHKLHLLGGKILVHSNKEEDSSLPYKFLGLNEVLKSSDAISVHVPHNKETSQMFNEKAFNKMKKGAVFLNTSRGEVVNELDLINALKSNHLHGAALDVRSQEPPVTSELEELKNVLLSPHIAAFTNEAQSRVSDSILQDISLFFSGSNPKCLVKY